VRLVLSFAFVSLLACSVVWGQAISTSQIKGTVQDASGLAVPGAEVKVIQTATGAVRTVASGPDGGYLFSALPVGPYRLEVTKEGFAKYVQSGIVLQVDSNPTIDVPLKVGAVTEQVAVEAGAAMVETQSTGVGQVIDQQRVVDLPLNGRNVTDLIYLTGGVNQGRSNRASYPSSASPSIAGGGGGTVAYILDGGTIGGPIRKNRLFFFLGYQDTIVKSSPAATVAFVPTPAMLAGDFTAVAAPPCRAAPVTLPASLGFANNRIDPAKFNPISLNLEKYLPTPTDPCGRITYAPPASYTENQGLAKVDYQVSPKHSVFGRYFVTHYESPAGSPRLGLLVEALGGQSDNVFNATLGDTYLITPSMVSSFRLMANRSSNTMSTTPISGFRIWVCRVSINCPSTNLGSTWAGGPRPADSALPLRPRDNLTPPGSFPRTSRCRMDHIRFRLA
jgi:hypothetical protein